MIIDSHQHFWNYNPERDTWIDESMQVLKKNFLPRNLKPILINNGIDGCISVQADQSYQETEFLLKCASNNKFIKGVVGWVDLCSPNLEKKLEKYTSDKMFKGVRHIVQSESPEYLLRKDVQSGISKLSKFNLTFDLLVTPIQLQSAIKLVKIFPSQKFVLDHIAKPRISEPLNKTWVSDIINLSKYSNVFCKISGLVTETKGYNFSETDFLPFLDVIFKYFGFDRIMYGSDWPVCLLAADYKKVLEIISNYLMSYDSKIREKIMGTNAKIFYNL
ncbi:MAG: amidohydrolase family protein [Bacteroidota bacterium]|nr:amidohydrolase family protein [Bacteroidota bacterium]